MIKISAILTCYNSENTVERVLTSILEQEGIGKQFELELIVVDDCSTDSTRAILERKGIPYYSTAYNSGGPNRGRNIGLEKSSGQIITLVDHDDAWQAGRIAKVLNYIDQAPIISSGYSSIDSQLKRIRNAIPKRHNPSSEVNYYGKNETFLNKLKRSKKGQNTYLGSLFFSRDLKSIEFEEKFGQVDYDWVLRLFENQDSIEICDSLFRRYVGGDNLSLNEEYRKNDYQHSIESIQNNYMEKYPNEAKLGIDRINGSMARYYYRMENMPKARSFLKKSDLSLKSMLYYVSSFWGYKWVNKHFNVFG